MKKLLFVCVALLSLAPLSAEAQTYVSGSSGTTWRVGPKVGYSAVGYFCNHKQESFLDAVNIALMARDVDSGLIAELQYVDMTGRKNSGNLSYVGLMAGTDSREDTEAGGMYFRYGLNFDFLVKANDGSESLRSYYNKMLFGMTFGAGIEWQHIGFIADFKTNVLTNVLKKAHRTTNKPDFLPTLTFAVYYLF